MKWGSKVRQGGTRTITKFAFFPIRIRDRWAVPEVEWRWLEKVKILQEYHTICDDVNLIRDLQIFLFGGYWKNERFLEFNLEEKRAEKLKKLGI